MEKRHQIGGILDWFRKRGSLPPSPKESRGLIPRSPASPAVAPAKKEKRSLIDFFVPKLEVFVPKKEEERAIAPRERSKPERGMSFWERALGPPEEPEEPQPIEGFFAPAPIQEQPEPFREGPKPTLLHVPAIETYWQLPSVKELASWFQGTLDTPHLFADLEKVRKSREFLSAMARQTVSGQPVIVPVSTVVWQEFYTDFANFYGIPIAVIESYLQGAETQRERDAADQKLWDEVIAPLNFRLTEAFDLLKPGDLPGFFTVTYREENMTYWLYYIEAMLRLEFGKEKG